LALTLLVQSGAGAHAQDAGDRPSAGASDDMAEARRLFERGKAAMSEGRFAEARDMLQRSLDLVPRPSAAFNLAVAYRGMGKPKEAHDVLTRLLAGQFGSVPPDKRAEAEQLKAEAQKDVAELRIVVRGATEADVRVEGASAGHVRDGQPLLVDVNPGEHLVTATAKLRTPAERSVVVAAGGRANVTLTLELSREASRATLLVTSKDPNLTVEIVGVGAARGRIERTLDPGRYTLRITSPAGTRSSTVRLDPATNHRVELEAPKSSMLASPWFWVAAGTAAAGAAVGGYLLLRPRAQEPVRDPEFGLVETSRRR
jgi:hypothetical protein